MAYAGDARQADTCPEGTEFYKCAVGPFTGCCSANPCDTGVCGDVDDCNPSLPAGGQASAPTMPEEQTTTLMVTVSDEVTPPTVTITISDIITSLITEAAASTTPHAPATQQTLDSLKPGLSAITPSLENSRASNYLSAESTLTETPFPSIRTTAAPATVAITKSSKTRSLETKEIPSATAIPHNSKGPHTSAFIGGIAGGLSLLALLALLLLCCCCRRRAKYSFSVKRKSKEDKEEQERAELLQKAEEAALQRQSVLDAAISTGAQSPVTRGGTADFGPSPYPRNSTAIPPKHWI